MLSIDIIVPTYNRPDDVRKFVKEILKQKYVNYKVYIVDDCGDCDLTWLENFNNKINYLRLEKNRGQAFARNFAVKNSNSDFLLFLDDDAWFLDDDALDNFIKEVSESDADGWMLDVQEPNKALLSKRVKSKAGDEIGEFIACACAFKRISFITVGSFSEGFHSYGEETEFVIRMKSFNQTMCFLPQIKVFHNYHPTKRSAEWFNRFHLNS